MNTNSFIRAALHSTERPFASPRRARQSLAAAAVLIAFGMTAVTALAPPPLPTKAQLLAAYVDANAQTLSVSAAVAPASVARDSYSATPGIQTLAASGTNYDWAKLVMLFAGWPATESNVTVFTRWMRQENGADDWWNRNNPLNNGWGSGGGGGTGSYDNLVIAAQNAADALLKNSGYSGIRDAFAASAPTEVIEQAIWNSPWASGHYAYGGHWSYATVPVVKSPDGTW